MIRRERIAHDRAEMVQRALVHAGYLSGKETEEQKKSIDFRELCVSFLADLLHLGTQQYGLEFGPERQVRGADQTELKVADWAKEAAKYYADETQEERSEL